MPRAPENTTGPPPNHITHVDDEDILNRGNGHPALGVIIPNFQAFLLGLLEKNSYTTEVSVGSNAKLTFFGGAGRRVTDHLLDDNGFGGEALEERLGVSQAAEADLPNKAAELMSSLKVLPDWILELVGWKVGPDVGAVEALNFRLVATNVESLELY